MEVIIGGKIMKKFSLLKILSLFVFAFSLYIFNINETSASTQSWCFYKGSGNTDIITIAKNSGTIKKLSIYEENNHTSFYYLKDDGSDEDFNADGGCPSEYKYSKKKTYKNIDGVYAQFSLPIENNNTIIGFLLLADGKTLYMTRSITNNTFYIQNKDVLYSDFCKIDNGSYKCSSDNIYLKTVKTKDLYYDVLKASQGDGQKAVATIYSSDTSTTIIENDCTKNYSKKDSFVYDESNISKPFIRNAKKNGNNCILTIQIGKNFDETKEITVSNDSVCDSKNYFIGTYKTDKSYAILNKYDNPKCTGNSEYINPDKSQIEYYQCSYTALDIDDNEHSMSFNFKKSDSGVEHKIDSINVTGCSVTFPISTDYEWNEIINEDGTCKQDVKPFVHLDNCSITKNALKEEQEEDSNYKDLEYEKYKPICGIFKKDGKLLPIIKNIYKIFKIALPVLILILTIVEFLKVLFSGEDKTMKDAFKATTTRLILLVVVVLSPILIEFIIRIAGVSENCLQYFVK